MKQVTKNTADWQLKPGKQDELLTEMAKAGISRYKMSMLIWGRKQMFRARLMGNGYFSHDEVQIIAESMELTYWEIGEMFKPISKMAAKILEAAKTTSKPKPKKQETEQCTTVLRISNGYQINFVGPDGKAHSAYGPTELDARVAMAKRIKQLREAEKPKEPEAEPPKEGDRLSVTISGDEAMVLLNQLMNDFRHNAVNEEDKPVIQSIFLRLSTQII